MSDYARNWDFSAKTGQVISGTEVDDEFDALVVAVNSKVDESREAQANGIATLNGSALLPAGISGNAISGGGQIPEASATSLGAVELATSLEATTRTDPLRVITPDTLNDVLAQAAGTGLNWDDGLGTLNLADNLDDLVSLTPSDGAFIVGNDTEFITESGATARASLGLGDLAIQNTITESQISDFGTYLAQGGSITSGTITTLTSTTSNITTANVGTCTISNALNLANTNCQLTKNLANQMEVSGQTAFTIGTGQDNANYTSARIYFDTLAPTTQGADGDIWFEYTV